MADVDISTQAVDADGATPSFTALNATDTYFVKRRSGTILYFKNTGGSEATITFDVVQTPGGLTVVDPTATVAATTGETVVGGLPDEYEILTGANEGKFKFTCDQASGVSVAVLKA